MDEIVIFKSRVASVNAVADYVDSHDQSKVSFTSVVKFTDNNRLNEYYNYDYDGGSEVKTLVGYFIPANLEICEEYEFVMRKVKKPASLQDKDNNRVFQEDDLGEGIPF